MKLSITLLLTIFVLSQTSLSLEGCVPGKCALCVFNDLRKPSCSECHNSMVRVDKNNQAFCEGDISIPNCTHGEMVVIGEDEPKFLCKTCKTGYMPDITFENCIKSEIENCLNVAVILINKGKGSKKVCLTCSPGFAPLEDGGKCGKIPSDSVVKDCLVYGGIRVDRDVGEKPYC